jgi:hypothetical protein
MANAPEYADLYFTAEQLMLTADETVLVANDIFGRAPDIQEIVDTDRAFIQRVLLIAVDKSEKAGLAYDLYAATFKGTVKQSVKTVVTTFSKKVANRWFKKYLDNTPRYSAAGRAALQYSGYETEWRLRVSLHDPTQLTTYLHRS